MEAKDKSRTYEAYVEKYGMIAAVELDALEPAALQSIAVVAIESVMDMDAYEDERRRETEDARETVGAKRRIIEFMRGLE